MWVEKGGRLYNPRYSYKVRLEEPEIANNE
jgi:hypothetical protein